MRVFVRLYVSCTCVHYKFRCCLRVAAAAVAAAVVTAVVVNSYELMVFCLLSRCLSPLSPPSNLCSHYYFRIIVITFVPAYNQINCMRVYA